MKHTTEDALYVGFILFNGAPVYPELSPVTDFREARCRQHEVADCVKGGFCNFMHLKAISRELGEKLYGRRGRYADRAGHYPSESRGGRGGGGGHDRNGGYHSGGGGYRDRDRGSRGSGGGGGRW